MSTHEALFTGAIIYVFGLMSGLAMGFVFAKHIILFTHRIVGPK